VSRLRFALASALAIGLGIGAIQCSLTTSLDGLTGGTSPDAGAADAPLADARADARADASSLDGSAEAAVDAGRYCARLTPAPSFCDDFDDEGPFSRWTTSVVGAGGSVVRDPSVSRSAPNSLLTTSAAATSSVAALLRLRSPTSVHRVRFAYDMRVEARDPQTGYAEVSYIRVGAPSSIYAFYIRLFADPGTTTAFTAEAYLPDGGIPQHNVSLAGNSRFTAWTRVAVDLDLRAAPHVSVTLDGAPAGDTALEPSMYPPDIASVETGVGYAGSPSSTAWQLRYDNVTVDWEP
jgi:hypothetical protein